MVWAFEQVAMVDQENLQRRVHSGSQCLESANSLLVRLHGPLPKDRTIAKRGH